MDYPRKELLAHVAHRENLCLNSVRQTKMHTWQHIAVSDSPSPAVFVEIKDGSNIFPLYLYPDETNPQISALAEGSRPNLSETFLHSIEAKFGYIPSPETIFYYIYAVLHSPSYRTRYIEFLKVGFPRIPITSNDKIFQQLSIFGKELVDLHLMKSLSLNTPITQFIKSEGNQIVDPGHPKYEENSNSVLINKKGDKFMGVPENVWNFYVGGYQVCQKWLKDRKGRTLTQEDITHYQRIVVALQETIYLMQQIDEAIPRFPIE